MSSLSTITADMSNKIEEKPVISVAATSHEHDICNSDKTQSEQASFKESVISDQLYEPSNGSKQPDEIPCSTDDTLVHEKVNSDERPFKLPEMTNKVNASEEDAVILTIDNSQQDADGSDIKSNNVSAEPTSSSSEILDSGNITKGVEDRDDIVARRRAYRAWLNEKRKKRKIELAQQRIAQAARARAAKNDYYANRARKRNLDRTEHGDFQHRSSSPMVTRRSAAKESVLNFDIQGHSTKEVSKEFFKRDEQPSSSFPDLAKIPIYLTEKQRKLFFSFVKPTSAAKDGPHRCNHCQKIVSSAMDAQRHAVGHFRVIRLRCGLCGCGAFFCSDLRSHLQLRQCDQLHRAPKGFVKSGNIVPCMSDAQADQLVKVVDLVKPGRVVISSGKIISCDNYRPYYPDIIIEEKILKRAAIPVIQEAH